VFGQLSSHGRFLAGAECGSVGADLDIMPARSPFPPGGQPKDLCGRSPTDQLSNLVSLASLGIMNTDTTSRQRALVVGLGISGTATALRLHRAGWDVVVLEKAPERRSGGYFIALFGTGIAAAAVA
jgi:FAD dependent oxidoreductase